MDCLVNLFTERFTDETLTGNTTNVFKNFYKTDMAAVHLWLESQYRSKVLKNNNHSTALRREGNNFYAKKKLIQSVECYTKSLCYAVLNSKEYGLALANRSASAFELKEFQNCLTDIELCLKTEYPRELKPKIVLRKVECLFELNRREELMKYLPEARAFIENEKVQDKERYIGKMNSLALTKSPKPKMPFVEENTVYPELADGESPSLSSASNKIELQHNDVQGRHIVAKKDIERGDVLFVEKAFLFAPIFKENKDFYSFKCYNCLKDIMSCIPCKGCVVCIFCNEACRDKAWNAFHRWECSGMQANIWYDLGIAFPAFRAMVLGITSPIPPYTNCIEHELKSFGDKNDNYRYFNRLIVHNYRPNMVPYTVMAAVVVVYLKKYTDFFASMLKHPNCPKKNLDSLLNHVGGLIIKHISQLACNSSIIEHWTASGPGVLFPDVLLTLACGIFPSACMMNHSCKANTTNFFIYDTLVVKALTPISKGQEVFNCYGVDYRYMVKAQRQLTLKQIYHFECKCPICRKPFVEAEMYDSYLCPYCRGIVPEVVNEISKCFNCHQKFRVERFRAMNIVAHRLLYQDTTGLEESEKLKLIMNALELRQKALNVNHKDFEEVYHKLYSFYIQNGSWEIMLKSFKLYLAHERARRGYSSRMAGVKQYEAVINVCHSIQARKSYLPRGSAKVKTFIHNVNDLLVESNRVLELYYPDFITKRLTLKLPDIYALICNINATNI